MVQQKQTRLRENIAKKKTFQLGQKVYLFTPATTTATGRAFAKKFSGPFRVLEKHSDLNYTIQEIDKPRAKPKRVHVDRMFHYCDRRPDLQLPNNELIPNQVTTPTSDAPFTSHYDTIYDENTEDDYVPSQYPLHPHNSNTASAQLPSTLTAAGRSQESTIERTPQSSSTPTPRDKQSTNLPTHRYNLRSLAPSNSEEVTKNPTSFSNKVLGWALGSDTPQSEKNMIDKISDVLASKLVQNTTGDSVNVLQHGVLILACLYWETGANNIRLCTRATGPYACTDKVDLRNLPELPANSCSRIDCQGRVIGTSTFLLLEDELISPTSFFDRPTAHKGNLSAFTCHLSSESKGDALTIPCDCSDDNCTGTSDFCSQFHCDPQAPCWCDITTTQYELSHVSDEAVIINPTFLSTQICLHRIPSPTKKFRRHLLENEAATFSQHNLSLIFNDPVVTVSETGTLIARLSGNEIIFQVSQDLSVVLPVEFTAYKDTLTLIFISASGKAVRGEVSLDGKSICRATHCVLCKEFFAQLQCWPPYVMYILYTLLSFFILLFLCFIRFAVTGIVGVLKLIFSIVFLLLKILKSFVRLFMLCGAVFGSGVRTRLENIHAYLEEHNPHIPLRPALTMAVLCTLISFASSTCTSHSILASDIKNCYSREGQQHCEIFTTAEITLKGLDYEACIWFQDLQQKDLFNLKLKLVSAQCDFSSRRLYFTFPVRKRTITQLACPQNYYCAWGEHCVDNKKFEALTDESMDYPGFTGCAPSSVGSGCTIISRMGCLFYRVYFIPDLLHSYEVRSITGHQCTYTISLERVSNNTKELLTFHSSAQTADGIQVDLLGAYNQAPLHFTDSLVLRVGHPTEAYLVPTSPPNRPIAGLVGQIQANVSFTKQFNFDKDMVRCDFFETTLRCAEVPDPLTRMFNSKDCALPSSRDLHLLTVDKGVLRSRLLSTAPVRLQIHFKNFKIHLQTTDICPKITHRTITTKGCYSCQILSEMTFEAFSSCQAGTVSIELQIIRLYTQTIILETEPKEFVIQFLADQKCYDEKICLVSQNMKNCQLISFCLNEPSLNLLQLNTSYTKSFLTQDSSGSSFLEWFSMPTFTHIFFVLKLIGATLLLICLSLTIFSACLTCCKR